MILPRQHATLLLNTLYEADVTSVTVRHPADEIGELLRIDLGDPYESTVSILADKETYRDRREAVRRSYDEAAYEELPDATDYVRLLVSAGLSDVANRDEIEQVLTRFGYPDLAAGHPPVMAGIDANVLPWRLPEVLGFDPAGDHDGDPPVTGFALASGVKEELDWHYKQYNSEQVTSAFGSEFERLADQPAGANREGLLGLYAYRDLMASRRTDIVECDTGDEAIVEGYRSYHYDENRKHVILFSNDHGFVDRARDVDLPAVHVAFPDEVDRRTTVSWDQIGTLLYQFTVVFGVVVLPKVTLYGVWEEKTGRHWQDEAVLLECRSPTIQEQLDRQQSIATAYDQL